MHLPIIFLSLIANTFAMVRVGPGRESAPQIMQRQMYAMDLVANSRDANGFRRLVGSAEAHRWGDPNNFFDRFQGRHITTEDAGFTENGRIHGTISVTGRGNDNGFSSMIRMAMDRNGPHGWKVTAIGEPRAVNRGKK